MVVGEITFPLFRPRSNVDMLFDCPDAIVGVKTFAVGESSIVSGGVRDLPLPASMQRLRSWLRPTAYSCLSVRDGVDRISMRIDILFSSTRRCSTPPARPSQQISTHPGP